MSEIMEIRQQVRLNQWSTMVREREESGLSVKAYCKQAGIATKTYYYRLRRLRESAVEQARFEATQPELVRFTPQNKRNASSSRLLTQPSKFR